MLQTQSLAVLVVVLVPLVALDDVDSHVVVIVVSAPAALFLLVRSFG